MDPTSRTVRDLAAQDLAVVLLERDQGLPVLEDDECQLGLAALVLAAPHAHLGQPASRVADLCKSPEKAISYLNVEINNIAKINNATCLSQR